MARQHQVAARAIGSVHPKQKHRKEKLPAATILAAYFPAQCDDKVTDDEGASEVAAATEISPPKSPSSVLESGSPGITIGAWSLDNIATRVTYSDKVMGRAPQKPVSFADKVRANSATDKIAAVSINKVEKACQTEPESVWFEGVRYVKYDDGETGYSSS